MPPLISIVGKSGIGKTTVLEKVIAELKRRGQRVAVIKHHAHSSPIDGKGKDSWRFTEAGASTVVVSSPVEVARFERVEREQTLDELAARITGVDLILTEGFKRDAAPKIEVSRREFGTDLVARQGDLVAVVTNYPITLNLPRFDLDDIPGIVAFLETNYLD